MTVKVVAVPSDPGRSWTVEVDGEVIGHLSRWGGSRVARRVQWTGFVKGASYVGAQDFDRRSDAVRFVVEGRAAALALSEVLVSIREGQR